MTIPPLSIKDEGGRMKDESAAVWNLLSLHPSARLHPSSLPLTAPVGQHALDALLVGFGDEHVDVECALPLGRLLRQDVARVRVPALDLARRGRAETLRRALVCFKFRHDDSPNSFQFLVFSFQSVARAACAVSV